MTRERDVSIPRERHADDRERSDGRRNDAEDEQVEDGPHPSVVENDLEHVMSRVRQRFSDSSFGLDKLLVKHVDRVASDSEDNPSRRHLGQETKSLRGSDSVDEFVPSSLH